MTYVLGISGGYYHDSGACLVHDGHIVAYSEEERWVRRKKNRDSRSCACSVAYCLEEAGITPHDVDYIALSWNPRFPEKVDTIIDEKLHSEIFKGLSFSHQLPSKLSIVNHHLAHAASSFYCSGFEDAAVLVIDGSGDGIATSLYRGIRDQQLSPIEEYDFSHSLGWFYETATEHVGFSDWSSAGKFMGLAAYGSPLYDLSNLVRVSASGYEMTYDLIADPKKYLSLSYYWDLKKYLFDAFSELGVDRAKTVRSFIPATGIWEHETEFTQTHKNFAASVQALLETCIIAVVKEACRASGSKKVCLSGGVALNCAANGRIAEELRDIDFFVCPYASDSGGAVGAALEISRRYSSSFYPKRLEDAALGPRFSDCSIDTMLRQSGLRYSECPAFAREVACFISEGKVVGWFHGKSEAGPRALGCRSILADPRTTISRDRVNGRTKNREMWRPLCPSILAEAREQFGQGVGPDDFMLFAHKATPKAMETMPGVIHIDQTMRCHGVRKEINAPYYALIRELENTIGVPAVLNTSFNQAGEAIVNSPLDAIRTFVSTDMDILSIGNFIATKNP